MPGLYVPLDVNYADDDKIIAAGPLGELLYVRALAFVKRADADGHIRANQLPAIALRIPRWRQHADRLVELGLWEVDGDGWFISAWFKRNQAASELHHAKSEAGLIGNHRRWHLLPTGNPSPDCKFCVANGVAPAIAADR